MRPLLVLIVIVAAHVLAGCGLCNRTADCPSPQVCSAEGRCVELELRPDRVCFEEGEATITIHVTAPDRITPASRVTVVIDGDVENAFQTDATGSFDITLPAGEHTITVFRKGFSGEVTFTVCGQRDEELSVGIKPPPGSIAVVPGYYDSIEKVLTKMGFDLSTDYEILEPAALAQPGALDGYRYFFINCGHEVLVTDSNVQANIMGFVEAGGSLYTSDWAINVVKEYWPEALAGPGPQGPSEVVEGVVLDEELAGYLGKTDVALDYNLVGWEVVTAAGPGTTVMIEGVNGSVVGQPLLVQFAHGEGRVTYTTFHNEAQTTFDMDRILAFLVFTL